MPLVLSLPIYLFMGLDAFVSTGVLAASLCIHFRAAIAYVQRHEMESGQTVSVEGLKGVQYT